MVAATASTTPPIQSAGAGESPVGVVEADVEGWGSAFEASVPSFAD